MKLHKILVALILLSIFNTPPAKAQFLTENMITDSSFRVEYLLGRQSLGKYDQNIFIWRPYTNPYPPPPTLIAAYPNPIESFNINLMTSQLVLDGMVEITPVPAFSGRLRANVSVSGGEQDITLASGPSWSGARVPVTNVPIFNPLSASVNPSYWSWEAACQYNLSYEGGYRFALVGGYRYESQSYHSANDSSQNWHLWADFSSQIPFLGLQTTMVSPTWKARCELLGSAFMKKNVSQSARDNVTFMKLDGSLTNGGFLELQVEGNVPITPNAWVGVYTQGTYEGLKGEVTGRSVDGDGNGWFDPTPYNFYASKFFWFLGLNCNVQF